MHFIFLTAALPLALASAGLSPRSLLLPRQGGDAFVPSTGSIITNCATPCGTYVCLDVPRGDTCCTEGCKCSYFATQHNNKPGLLIANGFFFLLDGCPGGSFCLTQGYCCPDGDDPATCASQFGVTLSSGFIPGQTVAVGTASSAASTSAPSSAPVSETAVSTSCQTLRYLLMPQLSLTDISIQHIQPPHLPHLPTQPPPPPPQG
ncbi:hypothetical protein ABVK25_009295 [Lepraria finkii]|uniref:Uncharacterized protein n=1 Tax=Lepraria finkii TaxID=1340010 RepID=A0ABR4B0J0_9LECA